MNASPSLTIQVGFRMWVRLDLPKFTGGEATAQIVGGWLDQGWSPDSLWAAQDQWEAGCNWKAARILTTAAMTRVCWTTDLAA